MDLWKIICVMTALTILPSHAIEAQYSFRHLEREQGLSHLSVTCCIQDSRGFMWFGTRLGLNVYDGARIKIFYPDPEDRNSLPDAYVSAIAESPDSSIWVGTSKGICAYDYDKGFISYRENLNIPVSVYISDMLFDKRGQLWFAAGSLYCYDTKTRSLRNFTSTEVPNPWKLIYTSTNELWVVSLDGEICNVCTTDGSIKQYSLLTKEEKRSLSRPSGIVELDKNNLLVSTTVSGVKVFNTVTHHTYTIETRDASNRSLYIHTLLARKDNEVWIGTEDGVYIIPEALKAAYSNENPIPTAVHLQKDRNSSSLSDNAIHVLYEDRESGVWVGTYFGGINYYASTLQDFRLIGCVDKNISGNSIIVSELISDDNSLMWIATEDRGLFTYSLQDASGMEHVQLTYMGDDISNNIHSLYVDGTTLWIGTFDEGIYVMDTRTRTVIRHYSDFSTSSVFNANAITKIFKATDGTMLVGTMSGLYVLNEHTGRFDIVSDTEIMFVHWIYQSPDGSIWIAHLHGGLFRLEQNNGVFRIVREPTEYIDITTIYEDSRHQFWVGTNTHGMFLYDKDSHRTIASNLNVCKTNKVIGRIVEDRSGCLWISTSDGLYCYNLNTKEETRYGVHNSLSTDQFNVNSGYLAPDGLMYFGTMKGLISFDPYKLNSQKKIFKVYFTDLVVNQSSFSVNFTVPIYSSTQSLWYRYKLKGVDNDWIVVQGAQNIKYTNLSPGTYDLMVEASTINGLWSDDASDFSSLNVRIEYPLLGSPLAIVLYSVIAVLLIVWTLSEYRKRAKAKRQRKLEKLRNDMDRELISDKIKFFTDITHEIRTPLTLIIGGLERMEKTVKDNNLAIMRQNVNRLHNLVNQLLDFRKIEVSSYIVDIRRIDMKPLANSLFTSFLPMAQQKSIDFRIHICTEECFVMADQEAVTKIITNMLSNATKFCDKHVDLYLSVTDSNAVVRVENDGQHIPHDDLPKVFIPFRQIYREGVNATINGTGLGLPLAKKMAELQNGQFYYDEESAMNSFVFSLPLVQQTQLDGQDYSEENMSSTSGLVLGGTDAKDTILLVDDEAELRQFVAEELSERYNILQAENGCKALEILETENVTLVVTDIMMPLMDGIELCTKIKSDIRFCHIPVVMLTSKVSLDDHIEALNSKSDAYIEKPFHTAELLAQVDNLISNRKLLCSVYVKSPYAASENIVVNDIDNEFLKDITNFVLSSMLCQNVTVEMLANHANMSSSTLYRKIKGLTSLSPLEFIRYCKLKKAAELLAEGATPIKHIAEITGFSSVSHFTACFTKQFGVTPAKFTARK